MISQHYFTFPFYVPRVYRLFKNWPVYLYNYLLRRNQPAEYRLRCGIRLVDNAGTLAGTLAVVFVRREYGLPSEARVIVDVGANMGCFALFAAECCRNATVLCYEPEPANIKALNQNISINNLQDRVRAFHLAVAGSSGSKELNLVESPLNSLVVGDTSQRRLLVNCVTLSDIIAKHNLTKIDLLKVNCEGAEYEIIEHCSDNDLAKVHDIRMEYHNLSREAKDGRYLAKLLENRGFCINRFTNYRNKSGFIWASRGGAACEAK